MIGVILAVLAADVLFFDALALTNIILEIYMLRKESKKLKSEEKK